MNNEIEKIAEHLYPENWITCQFSDGEFKHDNNAPSRSVAIDVIAHFMTVLRSEDAASHVMHAFYRREHGKEPSESDKLELKAKMSVALMAIDSLLTT